MQRNWRNCAMKYSLRSSSGNGQNVEKEEGLEPSTPIFPPFWPKTLFLRPFPTFQWKFYFITLKKKTYTNTHNVIICIKSFQHCPKYPHRRWIRRVEERRWQQWHHGENEQHFDGSGFNNRYCCGPDVWNAPFWTEKSNYIALVTDIRTFKDTKTPLLGSGLQV